MLFSNYVKFSCVLTSDEMIPNMFNATYNILFIYFMESYSSPSVAPLLLFFLTKFILKQN